MRDFVLEFWRKLLLAAGILCALWAISYTWNGQQRERGEAQALTEQVEALVDSLEVSDAQRAAERAVAEDSIAKLRASFLDSERRAQEAVDRERQEAARARSAAREVDRIVTDSTTARLIARERAAHEAEKDALRAERDEALLQRDLAIRTTEVQAAEIVQYQRLDKQKTAALQTAVARGDKWESVANPNLWERMVGSLPTVGATVLITLGTIALIL